MKQLILTALLGVMLVVTGCPLMTTEPIDNGSYTATAWLPGKWKLINANGTVGKTYQVKAGAKPGHFEAYAIGTDGKVEAAFRPVIFSLVGDQIFVSAYEEANEAGEKGYYIFRMARKGEAAFDLIPVKENTVPPGTNAEDVKQWLLKNIQEDIYEVKETEHYKKDLQ